jgi:hypothetical protein
VYSISRLLTFSGFRQWHLGDEPVSLEVFVQFPVDVMYCGEKGRLYPNSVEKLGLNESLTAHSLLPRRGRAGDDRAEAGGAGRAVLRDLDWNQVPSAPLLRSIDRFVDLGDMPRDLPRDFSSIWN